MKRKFSSLAALAVLMAGGSTQAVQPIQSAQTEKTTTVQAPAKVVSERKTIVNNREILPDGSGGLIMPNYYFARTPKEYGQWLQANGRQKWTKSKK